MAQAEAQLGILLPDEEFHEYIEKYPFAAEPTYFTRPNRYYGPASTWRSWTARDRAISDSLEAIEARDLSIHLYDAFALKQKSNGGSRIPRTRSRSRSKSRALSERGDEDEDDAFAPPAEWTAWPLRAGDVPGGSRSESALKRCHLHPSSSLEDALFAVTLCHAKDRWKGRPQQPKEPKVEHIRWDWAAERDLTKQQLTDFGLFDNFPEPENESQNQELSPSPEYQLPEGVQTFSSQAFIANESSSSEEEQSQPDTEGDEPVFSADDDHAWRILRPSVRHVLSKLDDLLTGLHKARAAYAQQGHQSRSISRSPLSRSETSDDVQLIRSGSRAYVRKAIRSEMRSKKRKRSQSPDAFVGDGSARSRSRGRSSTKSINRKRSIGLRDWSDIIGMAALTGWNTHVLARASERCARLFDENMMFRTFHEADPKAQRQDQRGPYFEEEYACVTGNGPTPEFLSEVPLPNPRAVGSKDALFQADDLSYFRTSSPCTRCIAHNLQCTPLDKQPHSTDVIACAQCVSTNDLPFPCSGIKVTRRTHSLRTKTPRTCPYPTCPRYNAQPFRKTYHLQRHLDTVHSHRYSAPLLSILPAPPYTAPTQTSVPTLAFRQKRPNPKPQPEESSCEGDWTTCPVSPCPRAGYEYARRTRLYEHIRRVHPEFDLEQYKWMISSGRGRKGKYVRSQTKGTLGKQEVEEGGGESEVSEDTDAEGEAAREREIWVAWIAWIVKL